jgi:hypothetical protein
MKTRINYLVVFTLVLTLSIFACKKDEDENNENNNTQPVTECFPDSYGGNYDGSGVLSGQPKSYQLSVTKLSCTTCKIEADTIIENVKSLEESEDGGYKGIDDDGNDVAIQLDGSTLQISSDEINFTGNKM